MLGTELNGSAWLVPGEEDHRKTLLFLFPQWEHGAVWFPQSPGSCPSVPQSLSPPTPTAQPVHLSPFLCRVTNLKKQEVSIGHTGLKLPVEREAASEQLWPPAATGLSSLIPSILSA